MSDELGRRFYIRYAMQRWERNRLFLGSVIAVLVVLIALNLIQQRQVGVLVVVLVLEILFLGGFYVLRRASYLELGPDGVRIRYRLTRVVVPYAAVARVRKQSLQVAFQPADRRRYLNAFVRRLAREPAVFIRIDRRDPELLAQLERRLGRVVVAGAEIVLPITDAEDFVTEMKQRLRTRG